MNKQIINAHVDNDKRLHIKIPDDVKYNELEMVLSNVMYHLVNVYLRANDMADSEANFNKVAQQYSGAVYVDMNNMYDLKHGNKE